MKAGTSVIDVKVEGKYGLLQHSPERFPHFREILARTRSGVNDVVCIYPLKTLESVALLSRTKIPVGPRHY